MPPLIYRHLTDLIIVGDEFQALVSKFNKENEVDWKAIGENEKIAKAATDLMRVLFESIHQIKHAEVAPVASAGMALQDLLEEPVTETTDNVDRLDEGAEGNIFDDDDEEISDLLEGPTARRKK